MIVKFFPTAQSVANSNLAGHCAIVIDVLRATTVITAALQNGACSVVPVAEPEAAMAVARQLPPGACVLGGERNADRIPGFQLGNSPADYDRQTVGGRHVVITTTNGTLALGNCRAAGASVVLACALINYVAVAQHVARLCQDSSLSLAIVAAGTEGCFSIEDSLCASLVIRHLQRIAQVSFADDFCLAIGSMSHAFVDEHNQLLHSRVLTEHGAHFRRLAAKGYAADVDYCLALNSSSTVGRMMPDGSICAL